ncbi:hypothetical protein [Fulvivirga lutea]|uniref:DUF2157 domain-containing protein n=1 Tax=Fulvivirga lutea TaxID=2810512 RepID=A0A975A0G9_9BACT|nr:hypothetical protein [Fulvivirga lutea]QSE97389.1 hypothetical protein JR347_17685 [Fulvivirga lutea]
MLGYDKIKQANYFHKVHLKELKNEGFISNEEHAAIDYNIGPSYSTTNIFINIGLFVLTYVIVSSVLGLLGLIFSNVINEQNGWFFSLAVAIGLLLFMQKIIIDERNNFRSGIDDALLYGAIGFLFLAFFLLFETSIFNDPLATSLFFIPLLGVPAKIYQDRLLYGLTLIAIFSVFFLAFHKLGGIFLLLIPFVLMLLSFISYRLSTTKVKTVVLEVDQECWEVIQWISIVTFYLAGNIFVVTELSTELGLADAFPSIVRALFYGFTIIVPLFYIYHGLKNKQLLFLNIGLILIAVGVFSIKYYHNLMSLEVALLLGGVILLATAYMAMRYFKNEKWGISIEPDNKLTDGLNLESIIIDQTLSKVGGADTKFKGEGGKFGGGGATGEY